MHIFAPLWQPSSTGEFLTALLALIDDLLASGISFDFVVVSPDRRQAQIDHRFLPGWSMIGGEATVPFNRQEMRVLMDESDPQALLIDQKPIAETNLVGSIVGDPGGDAKGFPNEERAVSKRETYHQVVEEGFR